MFDRSGSDLRDQIQSVEYLCAAMVGLALDAIDIGIQSVESTVDWSCYYQVESFATAKCGISARSTISGSRGSGMFRDCRKYQ